MMDHLFNDMEQNQKLEEIEAELERQREAVLKEAMTQYQDAAMDGDPRAQYALAHAYFQAQDYVTSFSWWSQAAKKGLTCAWTRVALQYAYGLGVEQDQSMAMDCPVEGHPRGSGGYECPGLPGVVLRAGDWRGKEPGASPLLLSSGGRARGSDGTVHLGDVLFLRQRRGGGSTDGAEMGECCGRAGLAGGTVLPGACSISWANG